MTIKLNIDLDPRIDLKARRTIDGNIIILDHEDIDIVLMKEKKKFVTFPKQSMSDKVYSSQDRMFRFLAKKGLISQSSIRGGNVFGSMEAEMLESKIPGVDYGQALLFSIHEYITGEKPYFKSSEGYDDDRLTALLTPTPEDSTELGDVPQSDRKGSMHKQIGPYGFQYNYSLVREGNESEDS
tara:strand:- start:821 stop:1369 length:549 start_codon:yes stop_codon:yes gene_type:complete